MVAVRTRAYILWFDFIVERMFCCFDGNSLEVRVPVRVLAVMLLIVIPSREDRPNPNPNPNPKETSHTLVGAAGLTRRKLDFY